MYKSLHIKIIKSNFPLLDSHQLGHCAKALNTPCFCSWGLYTFCCMPWVNGLLRKYIFFPSFLCQWNYF